MFAMTDNTVALLIIERGKVIIPVRGLAFRVTQYTTERKLNDDHRGALVISREGCISKIEGVKVVGYRGRSFRDKIISFLFRVFEIEVSFSKPTWLDLGHFKDLITEYIALDAKNPDPYLPQKFPLDVVFERVKAAIDVAEIFDIINMPEPEDCLDQL